MAGTEGLVGRGEGPNRPLERRVGTVGRVQFYGRNNDFTHAMKYGPEFVTGTMLQWQNGKQVILWPRAAAQTKISFPAFTHLQRP